LILGVNGIRLGGKRSGVGRCIEAVLRCLGELDHPFDDIRVYSPAPLDPDIELPKCARSVVLSSPFSPALWEQWTLPSAHPRDSVLLCPSYVVPLLARFPTALIHHGSYEGFPSAFSWWTLNKARAIYALSAHRASVVSTVSEFSRRDMVKYYKLSPARIHVVPEGVDTGVFRPLPDDPRVTRWKELKVGADQPFILYVGKPTERRNLSALIRALGLIRRARGLPHKLVIAGADLPGMSPFRQVIEEEGLHDDVLVLGYVGHAELALIYNAAAALVYPSSYEGFGMPVLEAMACGTPVIALNNTAFPEFAGGVARLLENADPPTLAAGIGDLLEDHEAQRRMRRDGPARASSYDWKSVTRRYLDLIIPLASGQPVTDAGVPGTQS
jgi:glycosyltransferase involved in cell wall biosynthesis